MNATAFRRRAAFGLFLSVSLPLIACPAQGQAPPALAEKADSSPWADTNPNITIPIVFTFSGGISLGSYQAGVNWAMTEFMKYARSSLAFRETYRLPNFGIAAMTGASAGNINAVLTAIEYCDRDTGRPPDSSLYWKAWVTTGWPELFPADVQRDNSDLGVLDRRHFTEYIEHKAVNDALRNRHFVPDCRIPIGIVVTRLAPGPLYVNRDLTIPTQRYAALFDMDVVDGEMRFLTPSPDAIGAHGLGARLLLLHEDPEFFDNDTVYHLIEASASYPVAFAPRRIAYRDPDCELHPIPRRVCAEQSAWFIDGGVFDNNPIGLALGVYEKTRTQRRYLTRATTQAPRVVYVAPGLLRGKLAESGREPTDSTNSNFAGVSAILQLFSGFIPSARSYELQMLARTDTTKWVRATKRSHPVVGEHLNAFGAFTGRPFREFDFYAGVADGIYFVAHDILCDSTRMAGRAIVPRPGPDAAADFHHAVEVCTGKGIRTLWDSVLTIGAVGKPVVASVLNRWSNLEQLPVDVPPMVAARVNILNRVEFATASLVEQNAPACVKGDIASDVLCADRFGEMLRLFGSPGTRDTLEKWAHDPACRAHIGDPMRENCLADTSLLSLLREPKEKMRQTLGATLHRLREVEELLDKRGSDNYKFAVKSAEFVYRSLDVQERRGWDLDPSSIPPFHKAYMRFLKPSQSQYRAIPHSELWWQTLHWLPYYVGGSVGKAGYQFGWQPGWHSPIHSVGVAAPVEISHLPSARDLGRYHYYRSLTPSLSLALGNPILYQLALGARASQPFGHLEGSSGSFAPEIDALFLGGKVRLSVYRMSTTVFGRQSYPYAGTVSLADANGLLYWLLR